MGGSLSTSAKQVFLKYYRQNRLATGALETDSFWTDLLAEINQLASGCGELHPKLNWRDMLPDWTSEVREKLKTSIENE